MVERNEALAVLEEHLAGAVIGQGRVAIVAGTVGIGKTELLRALAERVVDLGALAVVASGTRAERDLPLGLLSQLLRDAPLPDEERERALTLCHEGARGALADLSGDDVGQIDAQIMDALCTVLLELSERYPLAIVVDDVHLADRASLIFLAYLARRARFAQLLTVFSYSEFDRSAETSLHADLLRSPDGIRIRLTPLSQDGVRAMAAGYVGTEDAERFATEWYSLSGGNPLLVKGLLDDHATATAVEGGSPAEMAVGDGYGSAVVACLQRGEPRMLEVGRGLAVLSDPDHVGRLMDIDNSTVSRVIRQLTTAGVLRSGRYRHSAAREAVLAGLDEPTLAELHRRAAKLAYERGAAARVVAEHVLGAGGIGEPWALVVLEDAARQALREGAVEQSIAYLELARQECRDETRRNAIMTTLLRAEWRINPALSWNLLSQLSTGMSRGELRGHDAVVLAKALLWHGSFGDVEEVFERLAASDELDEPETVAELAISRPWVRSTYPSFRERLPRLSVRPTAAVSTVPATRRLNAVTVLAEVLEHGTVPDVVGSVEQILRGTRLDEMSLDTVECSLLALTYAGHAEQAAPWCDMFVEEAHRRRAPSRQARLAAVRSEIAFRLGDLPGAAEHARMALEIMPPSSWGVAVGGPLSSLILAATAMGRDDEVRERLDQPVPRAMFQTRYGLAYLSARGRYSLVTGHAQLALRDFTRCGELMGEWALDAPGLVPWRLDVAEARLALGKTDQAAALIEEQLGRSAEHPRVRGVALRLLAATSLPRHRPMLLRQSADLLQNSGDRYQLSRSLAALTNAFEALGESRRAGMINGRARSLARECQAPLGGRANGRAPAAGPVGVGAAGGPASLLSDAERRVAALAAVGHSNREIAEKLFVTLSTVEQHLTRTYRKLQVTSRADLPSILEVGRPVEA
ncbi:AAA family ATPase [Rugosimonospora acidiphila]